MKHFLQKPEIDQVWLVLGISANGHPKDGNPHQKSCSCTIGALTDSDAAKLESGVMAGEKLVTSIPEVTPAPTDR